MYGCTSCSFIHIYSFKGTSQVVLVVKNPVANAGDTRVMDLIPGSGRSSGVESGNPFQYSCLENPMDRGAWQATVHGVAKSQIQLSRYLLCMHIHSKILCEMPISTNL